MEENGKWKGTKGGSIGLRSVPPTFNCGSKPCVVDWHTWVSAARGKHSYYRPLTLPLWPIGGLCVCGPERVKSGGKLLILIDK